jgi:hypothetical protein
LTDEYKRGYADAMNWKVQNHLEHLPPAQRKWVGLTYEETEQGRKESIGQQEQWQSADMRWAEAKLKEKND